MVDSSDIDIERKCSPLVRIRTAFIAPLLALLTLVLVAVVGTPEISQASATPTSSAISQSVLPGAAIQIDVVSIQLTLHLAQASTICAFASGAAVRSADWTATGLPPGLKVKATPKSSCPAAIVGTPSRLGNWTVLLRATIKSNPAQDVGYAKRIQVKIVRHPASSFDPTINWASGLRFSTYNNVGANAVGDCAIAAAADYVQIARESVHPLAEGPWLREYTTLVLADGDSPGPDIGIDPTALFAAWEGTNQTGTQIVSTTPIGTGVEALSAALTAAPVFISLTLPPADHNTLSTIDPQTGVIKTPWSSAVSGPYGPTTVAESHSVLLVGLDSVHHEFLVTTWGQTYAVPFGFFESMVTGAWTIQA